MHACRRRNSDKQWPKSMPLGTLTHVSMILICAHASTPIVWPVKSLCVAVPSPSKCTRSMDRVDRCPNTASRPTTARTVTSKKCQVEFWAQMAWTRLPSTCSAGKAIDRRQQLEDQVKRARLKTLSEQETYHLMTYGCPLCGTSPVMTA